MVNRWCLNIMNQDFEISLFFSLRILIWEFLYYLAIFRQKFRMWLIALRNCWERYSRSSVEVDIKLGYMNSSIVFLSKRLYRQITHSYVSMLCFSLFNKNISCDKFELFLWHIETMSNNTYNLNALGKILSVSST